MAIVGSVFALLGRFAGRLLNSALGWATLLLFGKVPGQKQTLLLVIALASLAWVLVVVGVLLPEVGTFLLAFVPIPDFVDETWVRLAMLALALLIPLLVGIAAIFVADASTRPGGFGLVTGVLRGYPFTFLLAFTIALLAIVSLVRKARSLIRRWQDAHVPVVVKPGGYDRVLDDLQGVIGAAGLEVERRPAPAVLSLPPRILNAIAGQALGGLVPDRLMLLAGPDLEVLVYPSDIAISGTSSAVARSRAAIADRLTDSPAWLTTTAEAQEIEDRIRELADPGDSRAGGAADPRARIERLRALDEPIARLEVPFEEWETVYRQRLQVERDLLRGDRVRPTLATATLAERPDDAPAAPLARAVGLIGIALVAIDVVLLLADRLGLLRRPAGQSRKRSSRA